MSRDDPAPAPLPASSPLRQFAAGEIFAGRYRLIETLGHGGMGVVWRAQDQSLELDIALKFLHDVLACDNDALRDLKRETRRALQLTHPHIVRVHSLVEDGDRRIAAIAMEYIPGENLTRRLLKQPKRYFSPDELVPWLGQLCEALTYAHHKAGIVHRDLKPANMLLDGNDEVRITDFGISASANNSMTRLTGVSMDSGTLAYMSPQQARGERPAPTDDLYALGSTLYELLTGKPPFYMGSILTQVVGRTPPSVEQRREELHGKGEPIGEQWEQLVASLLAKDPAARPASARGVASAVGIAPSGTSALKPGKAVRLPAQHRKGAKLIGFFSALLLLAAAIAFAVIKLRSPAAGTAARVSSAPLTQPSRPAPLAVDTAPGPESAPAPEPAPQPEVPPEATPEQPAAPYK